MCKIKKSSGGLKKWDLKGLLYYELLKPGEPKTNNQYEFRIEKNLEWARRYRSDLPIRQRTVS